MDIEIKLLLNIFQAQHCDRNSITSDQSLEGGWLLSSNVAEAEAVEQTAATVCSAKLCLLKNHATNFSCLILTINCSFFCCWRSYEITA